MDVTHGTGSADYQSVLGCEAVRSYLGLAASPRHGSASGSGSAIWIVPGLMTTSSPGIVTSSKSDVRVFSPLSDSEDEDRGGPVTCFESVIATTRLSAWSCPALGSRGLVPRRCETIVSRLGHPHRSRARTEQRPRTPVTVAPLSYGSTLLSTLKKG